MTTTSATTTTTTVTTTSATTTTTTVTTTSATTTTTTVTTTSATTTTTTVTTTSATTTTTTVTTTSATTTTTTETTTSVTTTTTTISTSSSTTTTSTFTTTITQTPTTVPVYNPNNCSNSSLVQLTNGTCVADSAAQVRPSLKVVLNFFFPPSIQGIAASILNNNQTSNSTVLAQNLVLYIQSTSTSTSNTSTNSTVSISRIDEVVRGLNNVNIVASSNSSFIMAQSVNQNGNIIVLGAAFRQGVGGEVVNSANRSLAIDSTLRAAATISNQPLSGVTSINMFIIDRPTMYKNISNSSDKSLASSVIVAAVQRNGPECLVLSRSTYFFKFYLNTDHLSMPLISVHFMTQTTRFGASRDAQNPLTIHCSIDMNAVVVT